MKTPIDKTFTMRISILVWIFAVLTATSYCQDANALKIVERVADKIIADTRFEFRLVPQKEELGVQVIDARFLSSGVHGYVYALRNATSKTGAVVRFGVNCGVAIKIWVNKKPVYGQGPGPALNPAEISYDRFHFQKYFSADLQKGNNEFVVRLETGTANPVIFLRPVNGSSDLDTTVNFTSTASQPAWIFAGPLPSSIDDKLLQPTSATYFKANGKKYNWQSPPQKFLPELIVDPAAAYQRDPYADWQYSHGAMVWSILALGNETSDPHYKEFVKKYTGFAATHLDYFRWQYDSLFAFRGSYHRIFRQTMLDDAGAPALPFIALYLDGKDQSLHKIIDPIIRYISTGQVRLADGTFCRPEPVEYTVWADDLFMSVPLLLQIAKATGEQKYYDDAARQAINFQKYLLDPATGLNKHGWFSTSQSRSAVYWGRANGWIAWATAELLTSLPSRHPSYQTILKNFQRYMAALVPYQSGDGMWHQVLDNASSYEETSCTAMFTLAMARGVRMGWLPAKYGEYASKGWLAVASHISPEGVVHGICRGTDIGQDQQFYMDRKTIDNDPRGLGAVITAGIEIEKLNRLTNKRGKL